jgi:hypothetical protein
MSDIVKNHQSILDQIFLKFCVFFLQIILFDIIDAYVEHFACINLVLS